MQKESDDSALVCHPCSLKGLPSEVIQVCTDCQQGMCRPCADKHKEQPENALHRILNAENGSPRGCTFTAANVNTQTNVSKFETQVILPLPKFNHTGDFKIADSKVFISSMVFTSDGRLLICNAYAKQLLVYNEKGKYIETCRLKAEPWDIALIKDDKAVVTMESLSALQFINTCPSVVATKICPLKWKCYGVTVIESLVYVGTRGQIHVVNQFGQHVSSINTGNDGFVWYIQKNPVGSLFYSSFDFDEIVCIDPKTKEECFKYQSETILKGPEAIAVDNKGFIYVTCRERNSIQVFSPNGEHKRIVLGVGDKISKPYGLAFNSSCSTLHVSNHDGTIISVFSVIYE